jgi:branched-subunit amino acid transport protein
VKSYLPLILGMLAVTYLPRLIPLIALTGRSLHPLLRRFLTYIPYTALSALIVRGFMQSTPEMTAAAIAGIGVAGICSWLNGGLILSVAASIFASYIALWIYS